MTGLPHQSPDAPDPSEYQAIADEALGKTKRPPNPYVSALFSMGIIVYTGYQAVATFSSGSRTPGAVGFLILLILLSLLSLLQLAFLPFSTQKAHRKTMQRMYTQICSLYSAEPEIQQVQVKDIPGVPRVYGEWTAEFERHSFKVLGDFENLAVQRVLRRHRVPERAMGDAGGRSIVTFYALRLRPFPRFLATLVGRRTLFRGMGIITRLSDGTILQTSFPSDSRSEALPNYITARVLWDAGISALVQRHQQRVGEHLANHAALVVIPFLSLASVMEYLAAEARQINAIKRERGFLRVEDLPDLMQMKPGALLTSYQKSLREILVAERGAPSVIVATPPVQRENQ